MVDNEKTASQKLNYMNPEFCHLEAMDIDKIVGDRIKYFDIDS